MVRSAILIASAAGCGRGGHALFHDAAPGGARSRQLAPLVEEIGRDPDFDRQPDVGTFVHFIRTIGA